LFAGNKFLAAQFLFKPYSKRMFRFIFFILAIASCLPLVAQEQLSQNKVERLYQRGTDLVNHANYGAAREVFTEFLAMATPTDTRRGEAEYYIAFSALNLGHRDGEKLIDQFIDRNPSSPKASTAYYDLANFFYAEGNYTKASAYFRKVEFPALTSEQQNQGHFKWGYSFFTQKKLDEALEQFNFVKRQSGPYSPAASYYAGFIESSKGVYDEALADLKRAESSPSYANIVPYLITTIYYKQKRYDTVIEYANSLKGRKDISNAGEISMLVAEAHYFKGDFKNAVDAYQKYFDSNARAEGGLLFRAGYANYSAGNAERGIQYLDKAAAGKDSVSYYASYYLGILYLKQGNKPLALNAFDYAKKNPVDKDLAEESAFQLGKVAYDAGKPDQAINEFETFLKQYPRSGHATEVKELLAQAYVNGNNYNKAIEYIEALPSRNQYIDQAYQKATYLKGSELFNKELYAEAVENFEKSLRSPLDKKYVALASFWAGEAYSIGRRYDQAVNHYLKVISLLPDVEPDLLLKTRYGLGYAYFNNKAYDKAQFNFKDFTNRTNANNPNFADALVRLGDCHYVLKQYADAMTAYSKAKAASTADADYILFQSAAVAFSQQKYADARGHYTELVTKYPKSQYRDDALYRRGEVDVLQGNYTSAVEGLGQLISGSPNSRLLPYAYTKRAAANYNLKQYDRTVNDYITLIRQFPSHEEAQNALVPLQEVLTITNRSSEFDGYYAMVKSAQPDNKNFETVEFATGKNFYFNEQYQRAVTSLTGFLASYPDSPNRFDAKYYLAESYYRLKQYDQALPIYQDLSNDMSYPNGNKVVARLAEINFRQKNYDKAIVNFHRLERVAQTKKEQYNAWSGLMESFYLLGTYDSADTYARIILERGNVSAGAQNKASLYLGKSAMARGDNETAKDEFLNTLNTAQDEYGAEAKYSLALIFYNEKQYKQAYETLISLNNDFAAYEEWVGKSFLLLADNFVATGDLFNARNTLQSLVDKFPGQQVKDQAKAKLLEIDKLDLEEKKKAEADTLDN
jgi:TolA-binding protein